MANFTTKDGSSAVITGAADSVASVLYPYLKLTDSTVGSTTPVGTAANPLPIKEYGEGRTTRRAAGTDASVQVSTDDVYGRKQVVTPFVTHLSSASTPITTNTNTSIVGAPGAGLHLRIFRIRVQNSSTTATELYWTEGSGGTKKFPTYCPQNFIASENLNGSWELPTNTALFINTVTTGCSIEWHVGYEIVAD